MEKASLGILVGGGPAPGINGVISAATIEAERCRLGVIGFYNGFQGLSLENDPPRVELVSRRISVHETGREVSRIDVEGGSILRTSRHNPTDEELDRAIGTLERLRVRHMVTIGGDDTALSASRLAERANGRIHVAHVPKTIDNDLPLPGDMPTFGFQTACELGAKLVRNLMVDASSMPRWFVVVTMGRTAGHLALGVARSAGATLALIPEDPEFGGDGEKISADRVVDVIEAAIYKRLAMGRRDGVVVLAEGMVLKLAEGEVERLTGRAFKYDEHRNIRLGDFDMAPVWKEQIDQRLKKKGIAVPTTAQNIGYQLRCEPPNAFDRAYVRELGCAAVRYLLERVPAEGSPAVNGAMVYLEYGAPRYRSLTDMRNVDGLGARARVQVRRVDITAESYAVVRRYMIRLEREDLEDPEQLKRIAQAAQMTPAEFRTRYGEPFGLL